MRQPDAASKGWQRADRAGTNQNQPSGYPIRITRNFQIELRLSDVFILIQTNPIQILHISALICMLGNFPIELRLSDFTILVQTDPIQI